MKSLHSQKDSAGLVVISHPHFRDHGVDGSEFLEVTVGRGRHTVNAQVEIPELGTRLTLGESISSSSTCSPPTTAVQFSLPSTDHLI